MLRTKPTLPTKPIEQYYVVLQYLSPVVELVYPSDLKSRVTVNTWNPVFTKPYSLIYNRY